MLAKTPFRPWRLPARHPLLVALALGALSCTELEGPTEDPTADGAAPTCTGGQDCGAAEPGCAPSPPAAGTPCTEPWTTSNPGLDGPLAHCTWGDDPRPQCRTQALCSGGTWLIKEPDAACSVSALPAACPSPPPTVNTECSDATLDCSYADGEHCWCSPCINGLEYPICQTAEPPQWACRTPAASCPTQFPQAGSACTTAGASCGPDCELVIVCEAGVWQWNQGLCPICAAPNTPVATPSGERPIASLRVGDLVYSVEGDAIVVVPLVRVGSTQVFAHQALKLELSGGAILELSPGHPSADGRSVGELGTGELLDPEHAIVQRTLVEYEHERTYDILPASSSGTYFAAGVLIGSSLLQQVETSALQSQPL